MPKISEARILILATDGFEKSELMVPLQKLKEKTAEVHIASIRPESITSWDKTDWGDSVPVDRMAADIDIADYDALVLPGGQINPDLLRVDDEAMRLVREFLASGKTIAAICHAPWLLVEADALKGRRATSYPSIRKDVQNAGAIWVDETVVVDGAIITSRSPDDLDAFVATIVEAIEGARDRRPSAA